ncbi:Ig-like domain-containing protein [Patescibacteria group bacterium]|nr:Ig-like domain-containing protein [Patescibacteria group bacterium]MBU1663564.1 Ig-like domain-containing protein [Patescibacteria group bacterium]MBU1934198.1 Ig-like domain-containing protein [Patescibacteria group bacterium]MBU2007588.1 Ig-like domain-containing protein [Patescibacteria group bacterium]MBU2233800.1 Ig-like domain-containing protein [Patescibacteria group bacterium]
MLKIGKVNRFYKIVGVILLIPLAIFLLSNFVLAAPGLDVGLTYPQGTGLSNTQDIRIIIAKIIRVIIGFLGIIAVGLIIYAGWLWMSSEGDEEKIGQAKRLLQNAIIGLIIILSAFAIASFILSRLLEATGIGTGTGAGTGGGAGGGISALGSGIISSHYPERNQKDVVRNTKIAITFKEAMDPATIISGNKINGQNIKIYKTKDGISGMIAFDVSAGKTDDNKTFIFKPTQYLGSPTEKIWYSVGLSKNIKKVNGDSAFGAVIGEIAYDWMFEVGTFIDNTPPKIESIIPQPSATESRNIVVQINFSEAVDPISASGIFKGGSGFNNIKVINNAANSLIEGNFYISSQYKTVEFLTFDSCGINSCGQAVYCLPGNKQIQVFINAAALMASDAPSAVFPYTGVVDMADNSFDGNGNGAAQGPQSQSNLTPYNANSQTHEGQGDDYYWLFNTNNIIDIAPPKVDRINPVVGGGGVDLLAIPEATFSKLLMSSSLNSSSINFKSAGAAYNYWITKSDSFSDKKTTVKINHDQFNENTNYSVQLNSGIKDIYQNCYTPCSGLGITGAPSCCNGTPSSKSSCQ